MPDDPERATCDECGSPFVLRTSAMAGLCPECAHWLYGYPNCDHDMQDGCCRRCGWTGATTPYIEGLRAKAGGDRAG